jgi:hypothetical protein
MSDLQHLLERAEVLLARIENHFPAPPLAPRLAKCQCIHFSMA